MKKDILHIIESSETGGAETIFLKLICMSNKEKYQSHVGLLRYGWLFDELVSCGYNPTIFSSSKSLDLMLLTKLIVYVIRHKIRLIHAHLFGIGVYATIAAKICRIPVVVTLHGEMDVNLLDKYLRIKIGILNTLASKTIFVSNYLRNCYADLNLTDNVDVIYNGIDQPDCRTNSLSIIRDEIGLNKDDIVIGSVGDIRPPKGYEYLIRAAKILSVKNKNIKFIIAGAETPLLENLRNLCKELELADKVHFLGYRSDISNIYNIMDIFLLPSISEGFSLSTIEAMSHGLPVIATRCGGPEEIIENNIDGLLIQKESSEEIADAITKLTTDITLREKLTYNAIKIAGQKFTVRNMVDCYEILYQELLQPV